MNIKENVIFVSEYQLKPYCLDEKLYPKLIRKKSAKNHVVINADKDINSNDIKKKVEINNELKPVMNEYQFQVENVLFKDLLDLCDTGTLKSLDDSTLKLSRVKTDSSVCKENQKFPLVLDRSKSSKASYGIQGNSLGLKTVVNKTEILLLRFGDELIACDNKCPHKGGSLNNGDIENLSNGDRLIRCGWHRFTFNLDQNGRKEYPAQQLEGMKLPVYKTSVDEFGNIFVNFDTFKLNFNA